MPYGKVLGGLSIGFLLVACSGTHASEPAWSPAVADSEVDAADASQADIDRCSQVLAGLLCFDLQNPNVGIDAERACRAANCYDGQRLGPRQYFTGCYCA
jgi:hypothetical protein